MFKDRADAGRRLASQLMHLRGEDVIVLGLPRGGVPVAAEVAKALDAPLDVIVVRKLGVPFQPELGMGAVGEGGVRILNTDLIRQIGVTERDLALVEARERHEVERRAARLRADHPRLTVTGRTAVVVDDGIATGATAKAACRIARALGAARVVLAVPVAPRDWAHQLDDYADELVCVDTPPSFHGVGEWYQEFSQTTDDEVVACLNEARERGTTIEADRPYAFDEDVDIDVGSVVLTGHLTIPAEAVGIVLFAHGSASSRFSARNRFVANVLQRARIATLLFDLLTPEEERNRHNVFDVELLGRRLIDVTRWTRHRAETVHTLIGYFGASTGAAAALWAAGDPYNDVDAVVSRGGRPDLAGPRLAAVEAPTLLIVGGSDLTVLELNRDAQNDLHCRNELAVIPGATHLFEEPGALLKAAELARDWFIKAFVSAASLHSPGRVEGPQGMSPQHLLKRSAM